MSLLDDPKTTMRKNMKSDEASIQIAYTDVNDDNENSRSWAEFLNREVGEDENDEIHRKTWRTEPSTKAKGKPQVDIVAYSYS